MLYLLRKYRRKLLNNSQLGIYFLYALGEIVLVVVGILIAVNIDNWNEQKKEDEEARNILMDVQSELIQDITQINNLLPYLQRKYDLTLRVLNDEFSKEDYLNNTNGANGHFIVGYVFYNPQREAFDNLNNKSENISEDLLKPVPQLKDMHSILGPYFKDVSGRLRGVSNDYIDYLTMNFEWYHKYDSKSEKYAEFIADNPFYKNFVRNYKRELYYMNYLFKIYKDQAVTSYLSINDALGINEIPSQIKKEHYTKTIENLDRYAGKFISGQDTIDIKVDMNDLFVESVSELRVKKLYKLRPVTRYTWVSSSINDFHYIHFEYNDDLSKVRKILPGIRREYIRISDQ